jgi:hypothetical protein
MSGDIELEEIDTAAFTDRYGKPALSMLPAARGHGLVIGEDA